MTRLLIIFFVTITTMVSAEQQWQRSLPGGFEAKGSLTTDIITLTDTIEVTLVLTAPQGYHPNPDALARNLVEDGEIPNPNIKIVSHQASTEGSKTTITFTLSPLKSGRHLLSFRDITFKSEEHAKNPVTLLSGIFSIDVTAPNTTIPLPVAAVLPLENRPILDLDAANQQELANDAMMAPEHNRSVLLNRSFPWHYLLLYPLAIIIIYGACRLVVTTFQWLWKPAPPPSATEVATQALKHLETSDRVAKGDVDGFLIELTEVIRRYVENAYHIAATDMTTEEFIQHLAKTKESPFDAETREKLVQLLAYADQVKFAQQPATPETCATALDYARQFILRT